MMTEVVSPARRLTIASLVAVLVSIALWGGVFARETDRNIAVDKDLVFLYLCGAEILHPSLHAQQTDMVERLVHADPPPQEHYVFRARLRAAYCDNYPVTSLSMYLAGNAQIYFGANDPAKDFFGFMLSSMRWGAGVSGAIVGVLCLIIVFWAARGPAMRPLMLAAFGAIVLAPLLYIIVPAPNLAWMMYVRPVRFFHILFMGIQSWLNPAAAYSAFSAFPRCAAAMVVFAGFALRWSGRGSLAYWTPILVSVLHQSEAPIVLGMMIGCDLMLRPRVLSTRAYIIPIAANIIVIALRERMLSILGVPWIGLGVTVAVLAALTAAAIYVPRIRMAVLSVWRALQRLHTALSQYSTPFAESLMILMVWFFVLLVSFAFHHDNVYRVIYLWSELPPRFVGLFQFSVLTGLTYPLWVRSLASRPNVPRWGFALIACLALGLTVNQWMVPRVSKQLLEKNSQDVEASIARGYSGTDANFHVVETPWYCLLLRNVFLGGDGIPEYFARR